MRRLINCGSVGFVGCFFGVVHGCSLKQYSYCGIFWVQVYCSGFVSSVFGV